MRDGAGWNPWHGCIKKSEGCLNCYVYRIDEQHGRDASCIFRTRDFDLPVRRRRDGGYVIPPGTTVYTCFSSDFLLAQADEWRGEAWSMMAQRPDLHFFFITKRVERLAECLPPDWGDRGYSNVTLCCTVENQRRAEERLPVYLEAPLAHRHIICEPLLEQVDIKEYLGPWVQGVTVGGESGPNARVCDYRWVLSLREQCRERGVPFRFRQTGARFIKDGRCYRIPRSQQHVQAKRAGIDLL